MNIGNNILSVLPSSNSDWHWPVEVGLAPKSSFTPQALRKNYWGRTLSNITIVTSKSSQKKHFNILLFHGKPEAIRTISSFVALDSLKADVILIKDSIRGIKSREKGAEKLLVREMNRTTGAGGIFFFETGLNDSQWFDQLMVELSHNHGIGEALNNLPKTYTRGYISPNIEIDTKLSTLVGKIGDELINVNFKLTKLLKHYISRAIGYEEVRVSSSAIDQINSSKELGQLNSSKELGQYLKDYKEKLDYSGESRTASLLLQLGQELKKVGLTKPKSKAKKSVVKPIVKKAAKKVIKKTAMKKGSTGSFRSAVGEGAAKKASIKKVVIYKDKKSVKKAVVRKTSKKAVTRLQRTGSIGVKSYTGPHPPLPPERPTKKSIKKLWETNKPSRKKTTTATPRYLQAEISKKGSNRSISDFLTPRTAYTLKVRIGEKDETLISETTFIDTDAVFKDERVVKAIVDLEIRCNTERKPLYGKITLPRKGNSRFANFSISTGTSFKTFEAEIYAYHKRRLLQRTILQMDIRKATDKPVLEKAIMKADLVLRKRLDNIGDSQLFDASIILPENNSPAKPPPGKWGDGPLKFLFSSSMQRQAEQIVEFIEEVVTDESVIKPKLEDSANVDLLRKLATQGSLLFETHLKKANLQGPLQIITNRPEFVPLEFVYSFPAPNADAVLCPKAKQALNDGACKSCYSKNADRHAHICPLGFWGLSHVIERHNYVNTTNNTDGGDYIIKNEPVGRRTAIKVLNRTQYAESSRVDNGNKGLIKKIDKIIDDNTISSIKAHTWEDWRENVSKNNPDNFILIVHMEPDDRVGVDSLEIGNNSLLPPTRLDEEYLNTESKSNTPFVILIGCETTDLKSYAFNTGGLLGGRGASIVLSNFTRIRGKHAGLIVMRLVELLKAFAKKEIEFGSIVLKLKQQLLAEGYMVSLTLLAHGDADWKVKT